MNNYDIQEAIEGMKGEFLADCLEHLDGSDQSLNNIINKCGPFERHLVDLTRRVHSIKGTAGTFGFPSITTIAHKLEDYIEVSLNIHDCINEIQIFLDVMRDVAESGVNPTNGAYSQILANLPRAHSKIDAVHPTRNVDILLAMHRDVQRKIIGQELSSCGFGTSFVESGVNAISSIIEHRPDIVISSVVLEDMSGIDLARALEGIKASRDIHFILLSSSNNISTEVAELPANATAIHKDLGYAEQLTERLMEWGYFGKIDNAASH